MPKTDQFFDPTGYSTVAERIALFYRSHPTGRIETDLISRDALSVTFKARVYRAESDTVPAATGWATEREGDGDINTVACLENTETSAIGRALANLGLTVTKQRPSIEEMRKAARARAYRAASRAASAVETPDLSQPLAEPAATSDLIDLLNDAELAGLPADRSRGLRERLTQSPPLPAARVAELERSIRGWLDRREAVTVERLSQ